MDAMEAILGRRSIRKYSDKAVPENLVHDLLTAAMAAPSAGNQQPWQFILIDERRILDAITEFHPYAGPLKQAPMAIAVCGDMTRQKWEGFWVQDCSAAVENLLVAAHAKGLGTVWLGVHPIGDRSSELRKLLRLPETIVPLAVVALGYPAEFKEPANRYDPSRVHRNGW